MVDEMEKENILETAMLTQFGQNNTPQFRQLMTGLTSMSVCFIVFFAYRFI